MGRGLPEYNSIHPSSNDLPHSYGALWDDSDIRAHRLMTDAAHEHGEVILPFLTGPISRI